MNRPTQERKYKVVLLIPPNLEGIENAQAILQQVLDMLNSHRLPPGMRFADEVTAELEVAHDIHTVSGRIKKEKDLALVIACGFEESALKKFVHVCERNNVQFCNAADIPMDNRQTTEEQAEQLGDDPYVIPVKFLTPEEVSARRHQLPGHNISKAFLTAEIPASPEVMEDRVNWLLGLLALGVMQAHHHKSSHL